MPRPEARSPLDFLSHVRVLEIGGTTAVGAAGAYLATLGAQVTTEGTSGKFNEFKPARGQTSYLKRWLAEGKSAMDGSVDELIASSNIVICDIEGRLPGPLRAATLDGYSREVGGLNRGVWVTISPFGLSGPNRDLRGGELVYLASGGFLAYLRSTADTKPTKLAGQQGSLLAGEVAGLAALHGLELARTGRMPLPIHLEVSAQEAILATGPFLNCAWALFDCPPSEGTGRYGTPAGLFPCVDGEVLLYVMEDRHWAGMVKAMGEPAWADGLDAIDDRIARIGEIRTHVASWTGSLTREGCVELLQAHGVPATPVNRPRDVLDSSQLRVRGFLRQTAEGLDGVPGFPAHVVRHDAAGAHPVRESLRVLDLTQVLGPPIAASIAGAMGADVIKVEDRSHLDVYRRLGPFVDGVAGLERSANFAATNYSKKSVELDLEAESGIAALNSLLEDSDVVIENVNPPRLKRIGLAPDRFLQQRSGRLFLSSSGFGRSGPYAGYRAYGQNVGAFAGLTDLSRDASGAAVAIATPWADLVTALTLAGVIMAFAESDRRSSWHVDVSMTEVVIRHLAEHMLAEANGYDPPREVANELYPNAPHGVYPTSSPSGWIAISVNDGAGWQRLKGVFGQPAELEAPAFTTQADRYEARTSLDAVLEQLCARFETNELFELLRLAGVAACPVWDAAALVADRHLADREFFVEVSHEEWGVRRMVGLPWRIAGGGPFPIKATARLGEHNAELLVAR
jgi:crotonobetainyl-CoA:carnitine CoA-transferase CaiB-like acyl-CoA transferase